MRWVSVRCLMWGHDDRIHRAAGRLYLECADCSRETAGWNLKPERTADRRRPEPTRSLSRGWRELWSQARRHPFAAVGLR